MTIPSKYFPESHKCRSCIWAEKPILKYQLPKCNNENKDLTKMRVMITYPDHQDFTMVKVVKCEVYEKQKNVFGC